MSLKAMMLTPSMSVLPTWKGNAALNEQTRPRARCPTGSVDKASHRGKRSRVMRLHGVPTVMLTSQMQTITSPRSLKRPSSSVTVSSLYRLHSAWPNASTATSRSGSPLRDCTAP
ncbi:hypothetical protein EYF80_025816 [Liparis tanakae]|uniref:Uncharacterized protein n=1 Tax=Liparis tanakae TaxID=230148 RepID=A0A4Z2HGC3_9TELE|nr:hypothetical protein EYF80_025816 [Liparis tanakae]